MRTGRLILYRDFEGSRLLRDMVWLMENYEDEFYEQEDVAGLLYDCMNRLLEMAGKYGFYGNLWHCYLTDILVNDENSYSCAAEMRGYADGTLNRAVLHDLRIFKELYDFDLLKMGEALGADDFDIVLSYEAGERESHVYNTRICSRICALAQKLSGSRTAEEMKDTLTQFYGEYGVGKFGLHKAFRVARADGLVRIEPVSKTAHVCLSDLVGYELAKKKLIENTEAFVNGKKANNCLLYGDAGTGKSTCIKALANEYYSKGLRIIEVYKHQFQDLNEVVAQIKNRNYKFIIYMDDLSFEEFEIEYKYLKAVIEGGLEKKPDNVLIYATSNRRHLIRENFRDREERDEDLHINDTVQEKLSLSSRFGVTIYFGSPDMKQFQEIVRRLAEKEGIEIPEQELLAKANQWELSHGGLSGRTAQQFIDHITAQYRK
ncbi:MAG: ATP-binding protein [Firmicutes bacterium]|nr:ATP-binding protein [Bacillota bacterium]